MNDKDLLIKKSKDVQKAAIAKKSIKDIKADLEFRYEKKYPYWVAEYILSMVYHKETMQSVADRIGVARTTLYSRLDGDIQDYIDELKTKQIRQYDQKIYNLVDNAIDVYVDLLAAADTDATRLRAAEMILKKYNIVEDKQKVDISSSDFSITIIEPPTNDNN